MTYNIFLGSSDICKLGEWHSKSWTRARHTSPRKKKENYFRKQIPSQFLHERTRHWRNAKKTKPSPLRKETTTHSSRLDFVPATPSTWCWHSSLQLKPGPPVPRVCTASVAQSIFHCLTQPDPAHWHVFILSTSRAATTLQNEDAANTGILFTATDDGATAIAANISISHVLFLTLLFSYD